jgi:hypothetical protein
VPTISLPDQPDLDHLRGQARTLQRAAGAGETVARQRIQAQLPDHRGEVKLSVAQLVVAREYGFPSWPRLRQHLATIDRYRRDPVPTPAAAEPPEDQFARLACLNYTQDGPDRWARAHRRGQRLRRGKRRLGHTAGDQVGDHDHATPLGWAEYAGFAEVAALLAPVTPD